MPKFLNKEELERERRHVEAALEKAESPLAQAQWRNRLDSLHEKIEELEREPHTKASVALLFDGDPVVGTKEIRADFAAKVLENFQNLVGIVFAQTAGQTLTGRGRVPLLDHSRLYVREMARGSVGFVLEEADSPQVEMVDTPLKAVVERTVEIIDRVSAPVLAGDPLEGLTPRAVQSAYRFADTLIKAGAVTKIFSEEHQVNLPEARVKALYERLNEVRINEEVDELPGTILGLLPESGKFEFRIALSEEMVIGDTSTDIQWRYISDPQFHASFVMTPVFAKIRRVELERAGRTQKRDFVLEDVRSREGEPLRIE